LTLSTLEMKRPGKSGYNNIKFAPVPAQTLALISHVAENKKEGKPKNLKMVSSMQEVLPVEHPQASFIKKLKREKIIQVRVEDGFAIAYGDVLLGEVDMETVGNSVPDDLYVEATAINLWDSNIIPYYIEPDLANKIEVEQAIGIINKTTVMEFVPLDSSKVDGIVFRAGKKNCYSYLGKIGGIQPVMLAPQCKVIEILHEILHALGFIHEQSRSDRDEFITILWENIIPEYFSQFQMVPDNYMVTVEGTDFDFSSIMLYKPDSFAKLDGMKTMQAKGAGQFVLPAGNLGKIDIERIDRIYGK